MPLALDDAERVRRAHVLEGVRHGRHARSATRSASADTVKQLAALKMPYNVSVFGVAAAIAALERSEAHRGASARATPRCARSPSRRSQDLGCKPADSQGNFIFVDVGRPAKEFRDACAKQGVMVGRDFPPFEKTHVPHLDRDDGRDAEGRRPCSASVLRPGTTVGGGGRRQEEPWLTRRRFVQTVGIGAAGALTSSYIGARGRENSIWSLLEPTLAAPSNRASIVLSSNENPLGPGKTVLDAIQAAFGADGARARPLLGQRRRRSSTRSPRSTASSRRTSCSAAARRRSSASATHVFTAKDKALVGTIPTYEECAGYADADGRTRCAPVALDADFKIDLEQVRRRREGRGAGVLLQPEQPDGDLRRRARDARLPRASVNRDSPDTTILVDEAYFDYVTDPDHDTHIPLAVENPRVIVARTFSKAYGMAGLRIGYAVGHAGHDQEDGRLGRRRPARARSTCWRCTPRIAADRAGRERSSPPSARATRRCATSR